jgi:hypothetical protein
VSFSQGNSLGATMYGGGNLIRAACGGKRRGKNAMYAELRTEV